MENSTKYYEIGLYSKGLENSPIYNEEKLDEIMREITKNITREVEKQNISLKKLSEMTEIHYTHIYKITKGQCNVGLPALIKIAYALNISPEQLFPFEILHRKTLGDRFDDITRELDVDDCNYLIKMITDFVAHCRRIKFNAKKNSGK